MNSTPSTFRSRQVADSRIGRNFTCILDHVGIQPVFVWIQPIRLYDILYNYVNRRSKLHDDMHTNSAMTTLPCGSVIDRQRDMEELMLLPPPFNIEYSSLEEITIATRRWTASHGYDLIKRSTKSGYCLLVCGRAGRTQNSRGLTPETRKRKTSTHKIGCPFRVCFRRNNTGSWMVMATHDSVEPHNHPPMTNFVSANQRRQRRTNELKSDAEKHFANGLTVRQSVLELLEKYPDS